MTAHGKTVLVTGGTSGIGEATARAYAAEGADVVITGRDEQRGRQIVESLVKAGARARFVPADLERLEDVQRLAAEVEDVDVLINNAGVLPFGATHEVDGELFDASWIAPALLERGVAVDVRTLRPGWDAYVRDVLAEATLEVPDVPQRPAGGRHGIHTEAMGYLLAEMQHIHRSHPGARW